MKKVLIAILGLVTLASASAFATQTRTLVMGENDMIMVDDVNMFRFPGRVNNYPNLVLGEFIGSSFYNLGVTWQFNDDNPWVLGTFVSYYPQYGPVNWDDYDMADFPLYSYPWFDDYYWDYDRAPGNTEELDEHYPRRLHAIFGTKLGGNNFGFSAEAVRASWEAEEADPDIEDPPIHPKQSFHQYTFGLGLTEGTSGKWDVGLSFMTGGWTNEDEEGNKINEPSGFMDLSVNGRYFWVQNPKITFVPHAMFGIGKRGVEWLYAADVSTDNTKAEWSGMMFDLGFGMNYTPAPNMLAVIDFGFSRESVKGEFSGDTLNIEVGEHKESYFVFPYMKIGFEGEVFSWMDIRVGGTTTLWSNVEKTESDFVVDQKDNTPSTSTYFGFGFNWGKLYLDTYTNPELLSEGLDFISGNGDDGVYMNWMVSLVYEMF